jgi:hypothetical protein
MNSGSCLCGSIQYQFEGPVVDSCYCHCSVCRKLTGSAFATYGSIDKSRFKWTDGESGLSQYQPTSSTTRYFCSKCGSFLLSEHVLEPKKVYVSLGTLDRHEDLDILYHQFVDSKAPWYAIHDDLPKHNEWPSDF